MPQIRRGSILSVVSYRVPDSLVPVSVLVPCANRGDGGKVAVELYFGGFRGCCRGEVGELARPPIVGVTHVSVDH